MTCLRPTLKDVAKLSGVSEISVSRVMRNVPNISSSLREKVEAAATELNYRPNKIAGALASNTTDLIGVVLPTLKNIEYTQILSGIESVLGKSKYCMMLGVSDFSAKREAKAVGDFLAWNPSGIIISSVGLSQDARQLLEKSRTPRVEILNDNGEADDSGVAISYQKACAELVAYWVERGYKRVAYLNSRDKLFFTKDFKHELINQLDAYDMQLVHQPEVSELSSMMELGVNICSEVLPKLPEADAIFVEDGNLAKGIAFYNSLQLSEKTAIASFGNSLYIGNHEREIDWVKMPFYTVGENAAKQFLMANNDDSSCHTKRISFPAKFVQSSR